MADSKPTMQEYRAALDDALKGLPGLPRDSGPWHHIPFSTEIKDKKTRKLVRGGYGAGICSRMGRDQCCIMAGFGPSEPTSHFRPGEQPPVNGSSLKDACCGCLCNPAVCGFCLRGAVNRIHREAKPADKCLCSLCSYHYSVPYGRCLGYDG